jgi:hypothetical protein
MAKDITPAIDPEKQAVEAAAHDKVRIQLKLLDDEDKRVADETLKIAEARQKLKAKLPIDPKQPDTWPWGIRVMAVKEGFYPDRVPLPGHRVSLPRMRKVGEVFEIAHQGHFSPFTNDSPAGWMGNEGDPIPAGADPNIPITTAMNQVLNPNAPINPMDVARQVKVAEYVH